MIDLDLFKKINDQFGHLTGDKVLKEVGKTCLDILGKINIIGRFGGEEFIVGLSNRKISVIENTLERLRIKVMEIPKRLNIQDLQVSISIGVCHFNQHKNLDAMIKVADDCLYLAKEKGRNQIIYNTQIPIHKKT